MPKFSIAYLRNIVSEIGIVLAVITFIILILSFIVGTISGATNPYAGLFFNMILPGIFVFSIVLILFGAWQCRRKACKIKQAEPYPKLDLNDPKQRNLFLKFSIIGIVVLFLVVAVIFRGIMFMDTPTFCGRLCHKVMNPEYSAYQHSSHARVPCVTCHIGPGASWFVKSKISGTRQVWHTILGDYPRPIQSPLTDLRPSRDTCEECHWPERFYGNRLLIYRSYAQDEKNTLSQTTQIFKVGAGTTKPQGIHWHVAQRVWYLPLDQKRQIIGWVGIEGRKGYRAEYYLAGHESEMTRARINAGKRLMDCIDCHNRASHDFLPYEDMIDNAITNGVIDQAIPYIKKEAMDAVQVAGDIPTTAENADNLKRISEIENYYKTTYPDYYKRNSSDIIRSISGIRNVYNNTWFLHMKVGPDTYNNWRSHKGCFRCHMALEKKVGTKTQPISHDCNLCHYDVSGAQPTESP